jgi:flagellar hook assembly protein FlgD
MIYDDKGRMVRSLVRNTTMALSANFNWNGLNDQQKQLPQGQYIILTDVFNLEGKTKKFKNVITLAPGF